MKNLQNIIGELRSNPMFNFSLSSKELFHSNFWEWLCNVAPKEMIMIFANYFDELKDCNEITITKREYKKFDLLIEFDRNKVLIIENKLKSIASENQLNLYSDKIRRLKNKKENKNKMYYAVIISMMKPMFIENIYYESNNSLVWKYISYENFVTKFININTCENYKKYIIDYVAFTLKLNNIISDVNFNNFPDIKAIINYKLSLEELRIYDIFIKSFNSYFCYKLKERLQNTFSNVYINNHALLKEKNIAPGTVVINYGYNNGGIIFIYLKLKNIWFVSIYEKVNRFGLGFYHSESNTKPLKTFVQNNACISKLLKLNPQNLNNSRIATKRKGKKYQYEGGKYKFDFVYLSDHMIFEELTEIIAISLIYAYKKLLKN